MRIAARLPDSSYSPARLFAIFRRVPQWATGRACPQVDHTRRPSPRRAFMRRFCLDPGPYGCTKGYLRNNTVLYCTYTTYTMCSVHRPSDPANPPTSGRPCDHSTTRGGRGAGRAHGAGAPGRVTGRARDATTRTDNRIESNVFPVSRAAGAAHAPHRGTHEHARPQTRATRRSTRRPTNRRGDYDLRMWNVAARATCTSDVDDACAREPTAKHSQTHDTTSRHASGRYPTPVHACIYTHLTHANTPAASTERTPAGTGYCAFLGATAHFCAKVNAAQRVLQGNAAACRRPPRPLGAQ